RDLFHSDKTGSHLAQKNFANRANSIVLQVVEVVAFGFTVTQTVHIKEAFDKVLDRQVICGRTNVDSEATVNFSSANASKVISTSVEELPEQVRLRSLFVGRLAGSGALVILKQRVLGGLGAVVLDGRVDERIDFQNVDRLELQRADLVRSLSVDSL